MNFEKVKKLDLKAADVLASIQQTFMKPIIQWYFAISTGIVEFLDENEFIGIDECHSNRK